jgi:hypothetical protein
MILLELNDDMTHIPKEVFLHVNEVYNRADKSNVIIKEYGYSQSSTNNFLGAFGGVSTLCIINLINMCVKAQIHLQVSSTLSRRFNACKA